MTTALRPKFSPFVWGVSTILAVTACGKQDDADEFRGGVPSHEDIAMVVPGDAAAQQSALTAGGIAKTTGALLGQRADLYVTTRDITGVVNGATVAVLALVKTITAFPPTSPLANFTMLWTRNRAAPATRCT